MQSKNRSFGFTTDGPTVYLRIFQLERQVFTIENYQKAVQYISPQENIGAVCCNTAYGREDKAFQGEPDIINRTLCVSTVVTACPNAALGLIPNGTISLSGITVISAPVSILPRTRERLLEITGFVMVTSATGAGGLKARS